MAVHGFNLVGYSLFFQYFIFQSDKQLASQVDRNQYNKVALIEIKMPLHLPYVTGSSCYERVEGEVQLHGVYYNCVKRKVSNDTLYLQCLPNFIKTALYNNRTNYSQQANDIAGNDKGKAVTAKKLAVAGDYNAAVPFYKIERTVVLIQPPPVGHYNNTIHSFTSAPFHPPQVNG